MNNAAVISALAALLLANPLAAQQQDPPAASAGQAPEAPPKTQNKQPPRENPAELEQESLRAYQAGEYLKFYIASLKLHNQMPYVPSYMFDLVRACALLGHDSTAYHYMLMMQQQGLAYDFNSSPDTESIRNTEAFRYVNNMMLEAGEPTGDGDVAFELKGAPEDYLAMAWDPSRDRFLVGTAEEGRVLAVDAEGRGKELLRADEDNGMWSVTGLGVDPNANRLWVSTAATPLFGRFVEADLGRGALLEFALDSLDLIGRFDVPADGLTHELGHLALTADGHVYVADSRLPFVFVKRPGAVSLEPMVANRELVAFTDIAVTPDNSRVFAADPVMGIFVIDPAAEKAAMLSGPDTLNLAGIQSLSYQSGSLYLVQGGIRPQRIIRLQLDASGNVAAEVTPMAIALEQFDAPGKGIIHDDALYYFANQGAADAKSALVMKTRLEAGAALMSPDVEDLKRMIRENGKPAEG